MAVATTLHNLQYSIFSMYSLLILTIYVSFILYLASQSLQANTSRANQSSLSRRPSKVLRQASNLWKLTLAYKDHQKETASPQNYASIKMT